ncbi:MAG: YbaB/EbfC family nucleoid-associated protein [Gracilimonas sp.]|uniref:Nucleoid-associated protein NM125_05835 n=1 Tax=Gracilimonas sediminicola TaxID=2952158 RepID=A0A9X2L2E7_9BACT|nr:MULTISPECIES: YbaB/EbfC family nucleoid-associated protein [Gracilimonas]MBO6584648.1 YbaB/EbfC family nucleoid-associated protein [Gracilimonas sp.]MBO6616081.1 YbaB/EbfC family nucleoid-associated protein [Gracilimonas sp.]MCP9291096.1 YbaB/EbfC family nucleoid-associated protein [Gracilimonas sediminicola]
MSNFNMADMFGKIQEMQSKMQEAQEGLQDVIVEAEAGGGMVKVKANGNKQIVSIEMDDDVVDPQDKEMLEDLIVAGVNKALEKAEEASKEKMQEMYKGMIPGGGIPGMDMSKFGL